MNGAPLRWRLILGVLRRMPQVHLSRLVGWVVDRRIPRFLRPLLIGGFARVAGIDREEAESPPAAYPSIAAYFTRRLAPGARSWIGPESLPGSPVDGVLGAMGPIVDGTAIQAKGLRYSVAELLAGVDRAGSEEHRFAGTDKPLAGGTDLPLAGGSDLSLAGGSDEPLSRTPSRSAPRTEWWKGGMFLTLYLSPRHYHRIHAPVGGRIPAAVRVPGRLLPVNVPSVRTQPDLFVTNARAVVRLDAPRGRLAVVAIGAFNVGRISTTFEPDWAVGEHGPGGDRASEGRGASDGNRASSVQDGRTRAQADGHTGAQADWRTRAQPDRRAYNPPVHVERGAELGAFHLGSTVVLVFGPEWGRMLSPELLPGNEIRLGDPLLGETAPGSSPDRAN